MQPLKTRSYLLPLALFLLAACATLGVPSPETFNEKETAAISTARGVISTARGLLLADKLTPDDVDNLIKQANAFMEAVKVAHEIHATSATMGEDRLAAAVIGLNAINAYLLTRK